MVVALVYLASLLVIWGIFYVIKTKQFAVNNGFIDLLNPGLVFLGLYLIYNYIAFFIDDTRMQKPGSLEYALLAFTGLLGIFFGTAFGSERVFSRPLSIRILSINKFHRNSFKLLFFSIFIIILMFHMNAGLAVVLTQKAITRQLARSGVLSGAFYLFPVAVAFYCMSLYLRRDKIIIIKILLCMCVTFGLFYLASSRGELLMALILFIYLWHYNVRRFSCKAIGVSFVALLFLMIILGIIRAGAGEGAGFDKLTRENVVINLNPKLLQPYKAMDRGFAIIDDCYPLDQYRYGTTYVCALEQIIPRFLLPWERHQSTGQWYLENYAPDLAARGGGLNFPPLLEAYMNFSYFGCFLLYSIYAFLINRFHMEAIRSERLSFSVIFNCLVATTLCQIHRHPFAAYFKNSIYLFIFAGCLLFFISSTTPDKVCSQKSDL